MPLFDDAGNIPVATIVRPGQKDQTGDINANAITEYGGHVEGTIERKSVLQGWVPLRPVRGTNSVTNFAVGKATLQKLDVGVAPPPSPVDFGSAKLTIDSVILARNTFPLLEVFQTNYDARKEVGEEHGKEIAKFFDESMFIQAAKASVLTNSAFSAVGGKPAGHKGGSVKTFAAAGDISDPSKLYAKIRELVVDFQEKDVDPVSDDMILCLRPKEYNILFEADQIINRDYVTSDGSTMKNIPIYKALGVPVIMSNNIPKTNIASHFLGANYVGDFTKLVGCMFSLRALLAGETIPLTSKVWFNDEYKMWFVDSWLSFAATPNRAEYAGSLWLP